MTTLPVTGLDRVLPIPYRTLNLFGRCSQVAKAADCKSVIRRFESDRRLLAGEGF